MFPTYRGLCKVCIFCKNLKYVLIYEILCVAADNVMATFFDIQLMYSFKSTINTC